MTTETPTAEAGTMRLQAYTLLTLTTLFWGGNALAGKLAVGEVSPMMLVFLRWVFAFTLIVVLGWRGFVRDWPALRPRLPFFLALGVVGFTAFNALFYVAAHSTSAVNIGIVQGSIPAFVLLGAYLLHGTRVRLLQIAGVTVTFTGVVVVVCAGDLGRLVTLSFNIGDIFMLIACLCYAGYTLGLHDKPDVAVTSLFTVFAVAALVTSIPLVIAEAYLGTVQAPTPTGWAIIAFVVIFPSMLAQFFWIKGVSLIGPGRSGQFVNLVPIFAVVLAVVLLGETFALHHLGGLALVLGGIWLAERKQA